MASVVILTTIVIVVLSSVNCERRTYLRYSNYLQKALPNHWQYDQKNVGRRVDTIPWWHQVDLPEPPLHPPQQVPWQRWTREGRAWALQGNRDKEIQRVRRQLLEEKLKLKNVPRRIIVQPQVKPMVEAKLHGNVQIKHKARGLRPELLEKQKIKQSQEILRHKRDIIINPKLQPEVMVQSPLQPPMQQGVEADRARPSLSLHFYNPSIYYPNIIDSLNNNTSPYQEKISENRDKRQILYQINQPPQLLYKSPRTTPNPFIRKTNIDDYEIVRRPPADVYRPGTEVGGNSDLDSSYLLSETSDLEYESDYTISMSDSEDWDNYPLTTPSGPNPGWGLSTLADIYQKEKQKWPPANQEPKLALWVRGQAVRMARVKRSPKEKKRRIGARKEKMKLRRKRKDIIRKRRIIRNSKEDKAVKEDIKNEVVENLLRKPNSQTRQKYHHKETTSKEILWSNNTHRIVEDKDASFKWINSTHYKIYKDNSTNEWYGKDHVLVYDEEYAENRTREEEAKMKAEQKAESEDYEEDYNEDFTKEEEEERREMDKRGNKGFKKEETKEKMRKKGKKEITNGDIAKKSEKESSMKERVKDVKREKNIEQNKKKKKSKKEVKKDLNKNVELEKSDEKQKNKKEGKKGLRKITNDSDNSMKKKESRQKGNKDKPDIKKMDTNEIGNKGRGIIMKKEKKERRNKESNKDKQDIQQPRKEVQKRVKKEHGKKGKIDKQEIKTSNEVKLVKDNEELVFSDDELEGNNYEKGENSKNESNKVEGLGWEDQIEEQEVSNSDYKEESK